MFLLFKWANNLLLEIHPAEINRDKCIKQCTVLLFILQEKKKNRSIQLQTIMNKSLYIDKMGDYIATNSNVFKEYITPKIML